ncbi:hypothetical protein B1207_09775 [Legionella quinlivanii]|uniref:Uncharacterized protein n=1 Tax=Legionella quinlivanii TaxID=45073 RepID=A0A364LJJ1_9GAMM|nr:EAL domain-containing protein [Legionella quinlivanii]RAP36416.1 hypothetical protein B1207_09775 [Legionella quinlivanii]
MDTTGLEFRLINELIESSQDGVFVLNSLNKIILNNVTASRITGYSPAELIGQDAFLLGSGLHDDSYFQKIEQFLAINQRWQGAMINRTRTGQAYLANVLVIRINDDEGDLQFYLLRLLSVQILGDLVDSVITHMPQFDACPNLLPGSEITLSSFFDENTGDNNNDSFALILLKIETSEYELNGKNSYQSASDKIVSYMSSQSQQFVFAGKLNHNYLIAIASFQQRNALEQTLGHLRLVLIEMINSENKSANLPIGLSLSAAVYPENGIYLDTLLVKAVSTMLHAKTINKQSSYFIDEPQNKSSSNLITYSYLKEALNNEGLCLFYQPIVTLDNQIVAIEAFLRCKDDQGGLLLPNEFFPIAEKYQLLPAIEKWVIAQALQDMKMINSTSLRLHVNISASQFLHPDFYQELQENLQHYDFSPSMLSLEINNDLMTKQQAAAMSVQLLQKSGVNIAVSCGYSLFTSYRFMAEIGARQIKFDRYYVRKIYERKVDQTEIDIMLKQLLSQNSEVIIEGIEREDDLTFFKSRGCNLFQGIYFYPPMTIEQLRQSI